MDHTAFEAWLRAIGAMSAAQRSVTFRVLALAEAKMDAEVDLSLCAAEVVSPVAGCYGDGGSCDDCVADRLFYRA